MSDLPPGWATAALQRRCGPQCRWSGTTRLAYNKEGTGVPLYLGKTDFGDLRVEPPRIWTTKPSKHAKAGDVLLSVRLRSVQLTFPRRLRHRSRTRRDKGTLMDRPELPRCMRSEQPWASWRGRPLAPRSPRLARRIRDRTIPVAPAAEQERIVAAIEEQFSRLDAAVATLEQARQKLRRMRSAVLEAAVTGRLDDSGSMHADDTRGQGHLRPAGSASLK